MQTSFGHDTIIFDEDPLELILNVDTLKIADLKKIEKRANIFGDKHLAILDLQRYLEQVEEEKIQKLPHKFEVDLTKHWSAVIHASGVDSNIVEFLDCEYFYKDAEDRDKIHFINKKEIPEDKKIIIMSATVPDKLYKKMFGQRVEVIDISDVTHEGEITQHIKYSYSRSSLNSHLEEANQKTQGRPTITFKSFNSSIESASPHMWFGNCSGYNGYTGKDINVLGCPHKNNAQYLLMGKMLGVNVDKFNREFKMQTVE